MLAAPRRRAAVTFTLAPTSRRSSAPACSGSTARPSSSATTARCAAGRRGSRACASTRRLKRPPCARCTSASGIDPDQDAPVVRGAAAARAQGRHAAAHQLDGGRLQLVLVRIPAAVRPLRRRAHRGRRRRCGIGREGESYPGIRKDDVHVGGRIALVDARGPFGNPTSDSARTMVTTATTRGAARGLRAARSRARPG